MRYQCIFLIIVSLETFILIYDFTDGGWNIPMYGIETDATLTPKSSNSHSVISSQKSSQLPQLSIEETYFRHIIRSIVEKSDPFVEYERFIKNDPQTDDRLPTIDFLIRFNFKTIVELKKLVEVYNENGRPNTSVHYKSMIDLLDSFNRMQRKTSILSHQSLDEEKLSTYLWTKMNVETSLIPMGCYYAAITILIFFVAYTLRTTFHITPLTTVVSLSVVHAVLFEYIKLYYEATARRTSTINKGIPKSCLPSDKLGVFGKISYFFRHTFTFQQDECYNYYRHIHVEPILDVSLLEAFSSVFRKLVSSYVTEVAHTFGKSIHLLLYHFPIQWQLIVFASSIMLLLFYLALLFKLEFHGLFFSTRFSNTTPNGNAIKSQIIPTIEPSQHLVNNRLRDCNKLSITEGRRRLKRSLSVGDASHKLLTF